MCHPPQPNSTRRRVPRQGWPEPVACLSPRRRESPARAGPRNGFVSAWIAGAGPTLTRLRTFRNCLLLVTGHRQRTELVYLSVTRAATCAASDRAESALRANSAPAGPTESI